MAMGSMSSYVENRTQLRDAANRGMPIRAPLSVMFSISGFSTVMLASIVEFITNQFSAQAILSHSRKPVIPECVFITDADSLAVAPSASLNLAAPIWAANFPPVKLGERGAFKNVIYLPA
jgi:hypothetical protein